MMIGEKEHCDTCGREIKDGEGRFRLSHNFCKCDECGSELLDLKKAVLN